MVFMTLCSHSKLRCWSRSQPDNETGAMLFAFQQLELPSAAVAVTTQAVPLTLNRMSCTWSAYGATAHCASARRCYRQASMLVGAPCCWQARNYVTHVLRNRRHAVRLKRTSDHDSTKRRDALQMFRTMASGRPAIMHLWSSRHDAEPVATMCCDITFRPFHVSKMNA